MSRPHPFGHIGYMSQVAATVQGASALLRDVPDVHPGEDIATGGRPISAPVGQSGSQPGPAVRTRGRRVAYLTNLYPKISHSFIQTEIAALERQGFAIDRFTIRQSSERLTDPESEAEAQRTESLLGAGPLRLAAAVGGSFVARPLATARALRLALRSSGADGVVRGFAYFAEAAFLARKLERTGVRHVHAHFGTNPAAVARLVSRLAPISYSFTVHGPEEFDAPLKLDLPGKIAEAAFVAGVSSFGRSQLMRWSNPAHWDRIHVVRCAAGRDFFKEPGFVKDPERRDEAPAPVRFLCVARLSAQKGLPLLVEAVGRVAAERPIEVEIFGDGEDRTTIEAQIARLGLDDNIRLLGWGGPEDIRRKLESARALVLPSFAEGLPVVLMEALALRRPVITCAVAGIPELVDGAVGWLIPSGSVEAIAQSLHAALDASAEELAAMGEHGRQRVLDMHDPDRNATGLAALLTPQI